MKDKSYKIAKQKLNIFLLAHYEKDLFSQKEHNMIKTLKKLTSEEERIMMTEILLNNAFDLSDEPERFNSEGIKELIKDELYFTEEELYDMLAEEISLGEDADIETIDTIIDCLNNHIYYDTLEQAEEAERKYWRKKINSCVFFV